MTKLKAEFLLLFVTLTAAIGWLLSKVALTEIEPYWFIGIRFLIAAAFLTVFCFRDMILLTWQAIMTGVFTGAVFGLAMMAWVVGVNLGPHVGESAFIVSLGIMFVPMFSWLLTNEKPSWLIILTLPVAILGLLFLNLDDILVQGLHLNSVQIILLVSAVLIAFHFSLTGYLVKRIEALPLTCLQLWVSGIMALSGALFQEPFPHDASLMTWGVVLLSAIFATSFRFLMQTRALRYMPATHAGMIMLLEPIWVVLLGIQLLGQWLSTYQVVGCTLIFSVLFIQKMAGFWRKRV